MRVICRANTGKALTKKHFSIFQGETEHTEFHVTVGKQYLIYAMAIWRSALMILLLEDTGLPSWFTMELFEVTDPRLPNDWFFSTETAAQEGVEAMWGYERLVRDGSHYEALLARDPEALKAFYQEQYRREKEVNMQGHGWQQSARKAMLSQ